MPRIVVALFVLAASAAALQPAAAQTITTPPPVSGRSLSSPESITAADVIARLVLAHENLELIRTYMGQPKPTAPFFTVSGVSDSEAFIASLNLTRRVHQLAFEQLRVEQHFDSDLPAKPAAHHIYGGVDALLVIALQIQTELGISSSIAERPQPDSASMTDVFNQVLVTGQLMNTLLDKKTQADDVFLVLTVTVRQALELHQKYSTKLMPDEPAFVANKTPSDVLGELETSYKLIKDLADPMNVSMLTFNRSNVSREATSNDVFGFALIIIAELNELMAASGVMPLKRKVGTLKRKFPSHAYQRARFLNSIIRETLQAQPKKR